MQEQMRLGPANAGPEETIPGQTLAALLALVGTRQMKVEALRARTRLTPAAFVSLLNWLQVEYLVDAVTSLDQGIVEEKVELTDRGEAVLVGLLERTCELPELR